MKRMLFLILLACAGVSAVGGEVAVKSVEAHQRYPWNGMVDIVVTMEGLAADVAQAKCSFAATNSATQAAVSVVSVTQNGADSGSDTTWTRRFVWNATNDVGAVKFDDVALTVAAEIPLGGVQLWENGPYWAECNVGASKPEESGYYFWWGDTVGYKRNASNDGWVSVKDGTSFTFTSGNCPTYNKDNSALQSAGYIDATGNLVAAHDAATAHLGAPWRMPTDADFAALISNCDRTWTTHGGVYGRLVTGRGVYASKRIFLPAAGYGDDSGIYGTGSVGNCWSSTPNSVYSYFAWSILFYSSSFNQSSDGYREYGMSVRPLRGFATVSVSGATTHLTLDCRTYFSPYIRDVTARQLWPHNKVALSFTVAEDIGEVKGVNEKLCVWCARGAVTNEALRIIGDRLATPGVHRIVWDLEADGLRFVHDATVFGVSVESPLGGVQLWENGPYWAECNVGATQPEEYGYYFWWGDTVGYTRNAANDGWVSVKDGASFSFVEGNCPTHGKDNSALQEAGYIDATGNLVAAHDSATAHLGAPWRMPTGAEFSALISNCDTTWTTRGGVFGRLVKGRGAYASKSIFLPAAGYGGDSGLNTTGSYGRYWSSTPNDWYHALYLYFNSGNFSRGINSRYCSQSVRPVRGFAQ